MYLYTCRICRRSIKGNTEKGVVKTVKHHYSRHTREGRSFGRRYCEEDILARIKNLGEQD